MNATQRYLDNGWIPCEIQLSENGHTYFVWLSNGNFGTIEAIEFDRLYPVNGETIAKLQACIDGFDDDEAQS